MTYRLLIKIAETVWSQLDLGGDEPAMTYQANNIAELKDRQANYSQELKLPLTVHNLTVLGLPDHIDSQTDVPYKTVECRLYAGEYELAGKGAVLVIDGVTDTIGCQILGSVASLFDTLEDSPMSALTEPSFTREYGGDLLPTNFPAGLEFVAASFTKGAFHRLLKMNPVYMLPVVNDLYLTGKILEAHGYTWVHNLNGYAGTDKNALPVVTLDPDADSLTVFGCSATKTYAHSGFEEDPWHMIPTVVANVGGYLAEFGTEGNSQPEPGGVMYTAAFDCTVKMRIRAKWNGINHGVEPISLGITAVAANEDLDYGRVMGFDLTQHEYMEELELSEGDTVAVYTVFRGVNTTGATVTAEVFFEEFEAEEVPLYGLVHAPRNLGFETQFDYFKAFVQRYGLTVSVDHATSTVCTYTMKQVYDNKAFARDWSDKLVELDRELSFRADGYARSNDIALKDNDEDNVKDKGTFTVADTTLDKEKTLFDLPFEAGLDWGVVGKFASVPVFDVPDLDDVFTTDDRRLKGAEYSGGKPHLVRVSTDTVILGYEITGNGYDYYHRATHITAQSLIDTYYTELTDSMLVKAKRLTCKFYLKPSDIELFDPFMPVYLKQYGAYFYVNNISNFIVGRLTSVELIKL